MRADLLGDFEADAGYCADTMGIEEAGDSALLGIVIVVTMIVAIIGGIIWRQESCLASRLVDVSCKLC